MRRDALQPRQFPKTPGVYIFRGKQRKILYIGRATDLRSRITSYFAPRTVRDRGPRIREAIEKTRSIDCRETDSVLDAYVLEANLIKKHQPPYNVTEKDNKSFLFVGITKEEFPRVCIVRGRDLENSEVRKKYKKTYGPFPKGGMLKEALATLRKILPYRDTCTAYAPGAVSKQGKKMPKKCFRAQLGLCPGVCAGEVSKQEYAKRIRELSLFFSGKKKQLIATLEKEMKQYAAEQEFEKAAKVKQRLFALRHIQDAHLIKQEYAEGGAYAQQNRLPLRSSLAGNRRFRTEAYDVAHTGGKQAVGVMVVFVDGEKAPAQYRSFSIRNPKEGDDIAALAEMLGRRLKHSEWQYPQLIVVDGGKQQVKVAEKILEQCGTKIPVVAVVKTEKHAAREILGQRQYAIAHEREILLANKEAHRFALARHRKKRSSAMFR